MSLFPKPVSSLTRSSTFERSLRQYPDRRSAAVSQVARAVLNQPAPSPAPHHQVSFSTLSTESEASSLSSESQSPRGSAPSESGSELSVKEKMERACRQIIFAQPFQVEEVSLLKEARVVMNMHPPLPLIVMEEQTMVVQSDSLPVKVVANKPYAEMDRLMSSRDLQNLIRSKLRRK
jgi:hypothetical protein